MKVTVREMQKTFSANVAKMQSILDKCEAEKRNFTPEEDTEYRGLENENTMIERKLNMFNQNLQIVGQTSEVAQQIRSLVNGEVREVELRATAPGTTSTLAGSQPTRVAGIIQPVNAFIVNDLKCHVQTGMKYGDKFGVKAAVKASVNGEAVAMSDTAFAIADLVTNPQRLGIQFYISNQAINGSDADLLAEVTKSVNEAIASIVEDWVLSPTAIASDVAGIVTGTGVQTKTSAANTGFTYAELMEMVGKVKKENFRNDGTMAFVMSSENWAKYKTTAIETGDHACIIDENGYLGGFPVYESSAVNAKIVFGKWSEALIGQFGGIRVSMDANSATAAGADSIIVSANTDICVKPFHPKAFIVGTLHA